LTLSEAHRLIVSGAADRTVLLWDTNRLRFMRELLCGLKEAPTSLSTSETGSSVVVAAGREMRILSINGVPLAAARMDAEEESFQCARPLGWPEWGCDHPVFVSGHQGGVVRFWRLIPRRFVKSSSGPQGWSAVHSDAQGDSGLRLEMLLQDARSHQIAVTCIRMSQDNHSMYTGDSSGKVVMWGRGRRSTTLPKWAFDQPDRIPIDERLLRGVAVQYIRTEKGDDIGAGVLVLACRLVRPTSLNAVVHASQTKPMSSDLTWDARRTYAQFVELQQELQRHGGVDVALPSKEERNKEVGLEAYLRACLRECTVRQSVVLAAFLQAPQALYDCSDSLRRLD